MKEQTDRNSRNTGSAGSENMGIGNTGAGTMGSESAGSAVRPDRPAAAGKSGGPGPGRRRLLLLLLSLAFNISMMFLLYRLFDPVFEGNDDITVVQFVNGSCGSFDPHMVYQNYLMGIVLSALYRAAPEMPWYSWFQFWALSLSFTAVTYVLSCRIRRGAGFVLALLVQSWAAYECYINLQYTKTAGVLAAAGMLLLWHGLRDRRILKGSVLGGIGLAVWSILYRYVQFAACAALTAGIPLLMLLDAACRKGDEEDASGESAGPLQIFLRCLAACAVLGVLLAGLVKFDRAMYDRDPVWKNYAAYNNARSELMDYGMPKYDDFESLYTELGISRTAYSLFESWNSGDTDVFSTEVMLRLAAARPVKEPGPATLKAFLREVPKGLLKNRIFRCFLVCAGLWLLFGRHDRRALLALAAEAVLFGALYYYLFLKGRYLYNRVDVGLLMSALLVLLYTWKPGHPLLRRDILRTLLILGVMAACAWVQIPGWKGNLASHNAESRASRAAARKQTLALNADAEHLYISKLGIVSAAGCCGPFEPMPRDLMSGSVTLGGWRVASVPYNAVLARYGFGGNPYAALAGKNSLENAGNSKDTVRLLDDHVDNTLAYLREYYDPGAEAEEAGEWNGHTIWKIILSGTP